VSRCSVLWLNMRVLIFVLLHRYRNEKEVKRHMLRYNTYRASNNHRGNQSRAEDGTTNRDLK
jgi:hypothetical protein